MGTTELAPFADRLLEWWVANGRKDLPWQHPRSPYRVWVSEIMLQQTQVTTVIPYFERWMERFPDIGALADAPLDDVLAHWAGLGYYARARNLHKAASICLADHAGELPVTAEALTALPGIGLSTANAIVSQSTNRPAAVLDGNVRRVIARHAAVDGWSGKSVVQRKLWSEAELRLPPDRGADYTQAIMDLGATLCTRSHPRCDACPVQADCRALAQSRVHELPTPKPRTHVSLQTVHMLVIRDDEGRILLEKRPPTGIWGGLWCLPSGSSGSETSQHLGIEAARQQALPRFEHRLSHVLMTIQPVLITEVQASQVKCPTNLDWFSLQELPGLGLPKPVSKLLQQLEKGVFDDP